MLREPRNKKNKKYVLWFSDYHFSRVLVESSLLSGYEVEQLLLFVSSVSLVAFCRSYDSIPRHDLEDSNITRTETKVQPRYLNMQFG